jgi:hypothetical protein
MAASSGCYKYVPTQLEITPEGEHVQLVVTRQGAIQLAEVTSIDAQVPTLRGTLMSQNDETLMIQVPVTSRREGFHTVPLGQTIRVPTGEILSVERREFDRVGTALLVAGGAGVAGVVIFMIMDAFGEAPTDEPPPPDESLLSRLRIPIFSIPAGM